MTEAIVLPGDSVSGQVDEAKLIQLRIKLDMEHGDCRFEVNVKGNYVVQIERKVNELTTAVCKNSKYFPQLLVAGGSVMAVCYGLYKLGYLAGNFSTGCLEFDLKVESAKLATIRRQLTKGRFVESLQDEVDAIIEEHQSTLPNLKKFTIQLAKEVSMKETDKQSDFAEAANVNLKDPVSHASNHTHSSIRITNEFSCNPERMCDLELNEGKYFVVVNNQRVELETKLWPLEKDTKRLLEYGGAPVLICYGLHKLGYDASEFTCEGAGFKIATSSTKQTEEIQWLLRCGRFAHKLGSEICKIIQKHSDILGNVNFTITSCSAQVPSTSTHPRSQESPTQVPDPDTVPKSTRSYDDENAPSGTQPDSVPTNPQDEDQNNPIKYHIGIFAHDHDMEKADRIKGHCDSLGYDTCIFDDWVGAGGEPLPRKVLSFIKECLVLFWIAPPQRHSGSYMEHWKNVALHNAIESNNSPFVVVIPMEYKKKDIVPPELKAYDPITEDNKIRERIKATVKAAQASTPNPPATSDSQNIPTTSGPPTDVPGPSITNIINIYGSSVGSLVLQGQGESDSKSKEE